MLRPRFAALIAGLGLLGILAASPLVAQAVNPYRTEPLALRTDSNWTQLRIVRTNGQQVTIARGDIARVEYLYPAPVGPGPTPQPGAGLPGRYSWVSGQTLVINADGTCQVFQGGQQINSCTWISLRDGQYRLTHRNGGYIDTITLSPDGNTITGRNNSGFELRGQRIGGAPPPPAAANLPGRYNWVSGQILVISGDGTCQVFQGGQQINSCTWVSLGGEQYRLTHRNGGFVDTIGLSRDGNTITGRNNYGNDLRGQRIGSAGSAPPPPVASLPGRYNWVAGQVLVIAPNGTCQVFQNGQQINSCSWVSLGDDRYRLTHRDGGWVDTITLSADGQVISGVNNRGNPLRGTRQ